VGDAKAELERLTLNATVAPKSVLFRHSDDEVFPFFTSARPAWTTLIVAVVLLCHELAVPCQ